MNKIYDKKTFKLLFLLIAFIVFLSLIFTVFLYKSSVNTSTISVQQMYYPQFKDLNFLIYGYEFPRVFRRGKWENLPQIMGYALSDDQKKFVACGFGGVYTYDVNKDEINYIYQIDKSKWYACTINELTDTTVTYTHTIAYSQVAKSETDETIVRNIRDKSVISDTKRTYKPMINNSSVVHLPQPTYCDDATRICAKLNGGIIDLVQGNSVVQTLTIPNVAYLIALKGNYLFYAVRYPSKCCISLSYSMHIYNIKQKSDTQVLDIYDESKILFFN